MKKGNMPVETNEPIPTMSTKLSETVSDIWSRDEAQCDGPVKPEYRAMYDAARALEERVAELEAGVESLHNSQASWDRVVEQRQAIDAATARAETAEARATNLDRQCDDLGQELERIEKQLYEACGERDVADHEVARLQKRVAHLNHGWKTALDERDALRAKLEKVRALLDGDPGALHVVAILDDEGDT